MTSTGNASVAFFDRQYRRQIDTADYALNPFEVAARAGLRAVRDAVRPGGVAAVNVLVQGTTYLEMFDPSGHCLFDAGELGGAFRAGRRCTPWPMRSRRRAPP